MVNLTIVVDVEVRRWARARAMFAGESVNAMLRPTLEDLAAGDLDASVGDDMRAQAKRLFPDQNRRPQSVVVLRCTHPCRCVRAGCERSLTEDLADGSMIAGVLVTNPFK